MDREHSCTIGDARPLATVAFLQFGPSIRMIETSTDEKEGMQELKQTLPRTDLPTVLIKNVILCTILQHTTWYRLPFLIPFICFHFLHAAILPQPTIRGKKDHTIPEWFPQFWGGNAGNCLSDPNTNTGTTQALGRAHHGFMGPCDQFSLFEPLLPPSGRQPSPFHESGSPSGCLLLFSSFSWFSGGLLLAPCSLGHDSFGGRAELMSIQNSLGVIPGIARRPISH